MRPVKLTMSAFGPYANVAEIDFDALGRSGVYLVCGDTGAGKTMIFDAICFALFGEASGDAKGGARSTTSLRSDYAERTSKTFVELTFEYRGKSYRVKRNPDYTRAKARGEGETKQLAGAEIELPDGRIVSGVRKVNAEVEKLLGIDSEQFKQIVMLAQGEFRKLLTADTDTRGSIFRKLFGTEVYEEVQERLAEECRKLEADNKKVKTQVATLAGQASFPEEGEAADALADRKGAVGHLGQSGKVVQSGQSVQFGDWLREALEAQLDADKPVFRKLDDEVEGLRRRWSEANALLKQVESRPALEAEKAGYESKIAQLKTEAPILAKKLAEQEAHEPERAQAIEQAARIEGTLPKYEELQAAERTLIEARERGQAAQEALVKCEEVGKAAAAKVVQLSVEVAALEGSDVRREKAHAALDAASLEAETAAKALSAARNLAKNEAEAAAAAAKLAEAEHALEGARGNEAQAASTLASARSALAALGDVSKAHAEAKAAFDGAEASVRGAQVLVSRRAKLVADSKGAEKPYEAAVNKLKEGEALHDKDLARLHDLQKRQRAGRAGLLAADLQEGEPCPVCGSTHHPEPARTRDAIPSDDELDAASAAAEASKTQVTNLSVKAGKLKGALDEKRSLLAEFDEEHGGEVGLDELTYRTAAEYETAAAKLRAAELKASQAEQAKRDMESAEARRDMAVEQLKRAEGACQRAREAHIAAANVAKAMREGLGAVDVAAAQARSDEATANLATAKEAFDKAVANAEAFASKQDALASAKTAEGEAAAQLESAKAETRKAAEAERLVAERVVHLKADLEFSNIEDARSAASRLRSQAASYKAARDGAAKAVQENTAALNTNEELLKAAVRRLESIPAADVDATKAAMDGFEKRAGVLKVEAAQIKTRIDANVSCLSALKAALEHAGDIEERYGRVKLLADAATGNLVGKPKIRFEAYVQAIYFDKVIAAANQRLKVLTSGQFELIRHSEGLGNAKAGLGLFVVDSFTGRARDASSLSGGESFQASLCLALGLSDIVQAHAGGIEFDTMFVDEGFGSLDQGALGNAISLLSDLSGGTKLVGIISHVEDLKANIPKKIVVTKTRSGSTACVES